MRPLVRRSAMLLTLAAGSIVRADVVDVTWLGGTGSWNDPTMWSGGVVPNNTPSTTFRVTIPSGLITRTPGSVAIDALTIGAAGSLRIISTSGFNVTSSNVLVDGQLTLISQMRLGANALLTGTGTISVSGIGPTLISSSGGLTIDDDITVNGSSGTIGGPQQPLTIRGHINGTGSAYESPFIVAGSPLKNFGTINASQAMGFGGTFTRADLGDLNFGPTSIYIIAGTLLNQGQTLDIDATHHWTIGGDAHGGTIQGGTINIAPGQSIYTGWNFGANLDNVFLNGRYNFGGGHGPLTIVDGELKGQADVSLSPSSLDGASRIVSGSGSLVIAAEAKVHGGGGIAGVPTFPTSGIGPLSGAGVRVINHGTILADFSDNQGGWSSDLDLIAPTLSNDGTVGVEAKSRLRLTGDFINLAGGVIDVQLSTVADLGLLSVGGELRLDSNADLLSLTGSPTAQPMVFYRIATAGGGVMGEFESITPGFEVMYSTNDIFARVVPEPSVLWTVMVSLPWFGRRRRS